MESLLNNSIYVKQLVKSSGLPIDWSRLRFKTILITGASGMIGLYLTHLFMLRNEKYGDGIKVIALARNEEASRLRFGQYWENQYFQFVKCDINEPFRFDMDCDYILHAASNTHPILYSTDPIGTITTNVIGTTNVLNYAIRHKVKRVVFLSSVEIYGENRGDTERFSEDYCGYIDCNTLRAGYTEGKRAGESLCQAYISAKNLDIVIPRISRTYGPTMQMSDSKAIAQFIKKAVYGEDIVLKSEGNQLYSYNYIADTVSAILYIMLNGTCGRAYNVADEASDITLKELAHILASKAGTKVIFELPDAKEQLGYSKATKAILDARRLRELGWKSMYDIRSGLNETYDILSEVKSSSDHRDVR